jgi:cobalamin biosynthesis protein CobT
MFTRTVEGRQFSYDVSLLMDCSGSMGDFSPKGRGSERIEKAYESLVILAEALRGLPDINLEILAFTADMRYTPDMPEAWSYSCNNQLFILKSFSNRSVGALPYFPSYHREYNLSRNNFDIGAIKLASVRLRQMPASNRKLLIVLSDGQPASDISRSEELLKSYIEELSRVHPILGIGLENPDIEQYYPGGVNINDLSELSSQVFTGIRNFLVCRINRK